MSDNTNLSDIEERLRADAKRLPTSGRCMSTWQLANVYRRRQRTRRAAQVTATAAVLLIAALAARFGGRGAEMAQVPLAPRRAVVAQLPPEGAVPAYPPDDTVFGIPFVIGDPAAGEEVITGIYVPEQVEPIDLRSLSPAERDAVRSVLGTDGEDTDVIQAI